MKVRFSECLRNIGIVAAISASFVSASADKGTTPKTLRVTSFNIRFYGLGGKMTGSPADEHRDPHLREFISKEIPRTDIIALQEIVDVPRLERNVVPAGWSCLTYDHNDRRHQHVVLCHAPYLNLEQDPNDDNFTLEEVAYDAARGRPALHALVKDTKGNTLARVIAVHLKAFPNESRRRLDQTEKLSRALTKLTKNVPTVILGDFNTYPTPLNEQAKDDTELMDATFRSHRLALRHLPHSSRYTYRSREHTSQFDHIWASNAFKMEGKVEVFRTCNDEVRVARADYDNPDYYYENISDHCPVSATLAL